MLITKLFNSLKHQVWDRICRNQYLKNYTFYCNIILYSLQKLNKWSKGWQTGPWSQDPMNITLYGKWYFADDRVKNFYIERLPWIIWWSWNFNHKLLCNREAERSNWRARPGTSNSKKLLLGSNKEAVNPVTLSLLELEETGHIIPWRCTRSQS